MNDDVSTEARAILGVFKSKGLRAGGFIPFDEFGRAIIWEDGFVQDEPVSLALVELFEGQYVIEMSAGQTLTERGEAIAWQTHSQPPYGARVFLLGEELVIRQVMLAGDPPEYAPCEGGERRVKVSDDAAIVSAVRDAASGRL